MALPWIDISADAFTEWKTVRDVIGEGIEFCMPDSRVHRHWIYEIDPYSMLGKVTSPMYVLEGPNTGKIHAWTIGIRNANYIKGQDGDSNLIGRGGSLWYWMLTLGVFMFVGNDGTPDIQQEAENEARLVSAFLKRNAMTIVTANEGIRRVLPLEYEGPISTPFSDGTNVIVASGTMQVEVSEALTS